MKQEPIAMFANHIYAKLTSKGGSGSPSGRVPSTRLADLVDLALPLQLLAVA
jgi:hypothetical protein